MVADNLGPLHPFGSINKNGVLSLYFSYTANTVHCSDQDLSHYLNNWQEWPMITHQ